MQKILSPAQIKIISDGIIADYNRNCFLSVMIQAVIGAIFGDYLLAIIIAAILVGVHTKDAFSQMNSLDYIKHL